jgi:hypothetical protein
MLCYHYWSWCSFRRYRNCVDICSQSKLRFSKHVRSSVSTHELQAAVKEDRHWPITLMGVFSTVLLSAGVLRHFYDIHVHRTVRGISFIFVGIDAAGDVFSLVSICKYIDTCTFPPIKLCQKPT